MLLQLSRCMAGSGHQAAQILFYCLVSGLAIFSSQITFLKGVSYPTFKPFLIVRFALVVVYLNKNKYLQHFFKVGNETLSVHLGSD